MKMDRKYSENQTEKIECGQSTNEHERQVFSKIKRKLFHT